MEEKKSKMETMIEDAVVNRLKDLFSNEEKGKEIINSIRDKVLAEEVKIEVIKENFEFEEDE